MSAIVRFALPILVVVAALMWWNRSASPESPPVSTPAAATTDSVRVRYAAGRAPVFDLPDGQRRTVQSLLNVRDKMRFGDFVWNDDGVAPGPVWVRIDLARQTISVFRSDQEIGSAVILYGTDGKPTPAGVFPILEKAEQHRSTLYDAEMPFMLRLTNDGVAVHASNVRFGSATHGCIGVPLEFARRLFAQVKRGDIVAIIPATTPVKVSA